MPDTAPLSITWRQEVEVAVRDGLACLRCGIPLVDDADRLFVRIDPAAGDHVNNVMLTCPSCWNAHSVYPEPFDARGLSSIGEQTVEDGPPGPPTP